MWSDGDVYRYRWDAVVPSLEESGEGAGGEEVEVSEGEFE